MECLPAMGKESRTVKWNFTKERWGKVHEIVTLMHAARVCYGGLCPKTVLGPGGGSSEERILCHDFDVALTFPDGGEHPLSDEEKRCLHFESGHVGGSGALLVRASISQFSFSFAINVLVSCLRILRMVVLTLLTGEPTSRRRSTSRF